MRRLRSFGAHSLFPTLLLGIVLSSAATAVDYRIRARVVPKGFEREAAFFELIKMPKEPEGAFDADKAPSWKLADLEKYISKQGIEFVDVNHVLEGHVGRDRIMRELKQRKGEVFRAFAHISHIYSIPYTQYSELRFSKAPGDSSIVQVAGWYKLTFKAAGEQAVIIRWEYIQLEGE